MEIVLYSAASIALLAFTWFLIRAARSLNEVSSMLQHTELILTDVKKDIDQIAADVTSFKNHAIPVVDSISDVAQRLSDMTEGLAPRVDAIYETVDDVLDVAHGVIEDVERIKGEVVDTIEKPIQAARATTSGILTTVVKGINLVKDIIQEFKKK